MEISLDKFNLIIKKVMIEYGFDDQINNAVNYANKLLED